MGVLHNDEALTSSLLKLLNPFTEESGLELKDEQNKK